MNNTVKQHARSLHLSGLLESLELRLQEAEANRLPYTQFLELVLQDEINVRHQRFIQRRQKLANFRELRSLESFYFQYGHASIADLGHTVLCFEGISELAATEIEEESLWDGQAKSSRYQDFSRSGFVTPPELTDECASAYRAAGEHLLRAYGEVNQRAHRFAWGATLSLFALAAAEEQAKA